MVEFASSTENLAIDLPEGWSISRDIDGRIFYVNHVDKVTTWIDPRERPAKPAELSHDELPAGWERAYDPKVGIYFINHKTKTNHMEDPRTRWKNMQEEMLKDYLKTAQGDLDAKREIYDVKEHRLRLAQDDFDSLNQKLDNFGGSKQSLCSNASSYARYDVDLLKADVALAKSRVTRLQRELRQIDTEVRQKQRGLNSLSQVEQRIQETEGTYSIEEAQAILAELQRIQYSLSCGEQEKQTLIRSLAQLKDDILSSRDAAAGSSPDHSCLCLPQERFCAASQTDISGDLVPSPGVRIADLARRRLEYDETRKEVQDLQYRLAQVQNQMVPGQADADYDRVLLIQEKEHLLRELCSLRTHNRTAEEIQAIQQEIIQLERDFLGTKDSSQRSLAMRFKLQEEKTNLITKLRDVMHRQASLESELKSLSTSTLSVSSNSSRGSLNGSSTVSTSSLGCGDSGSCSSLDIAGTVGSCGYPSSVNMQELHKRVERLLQQSTNIPRFPPEDTSPAGWSSLLPHTATRNRNLPGDAVARLHLAPSISLHSSVSSMSPDPQSPGTALPSYDQAFTEHQRRLTGRHYAPGQDWAVVDAALLGAVNQDEKYSAGAVSLSSSSLEGTAAAAAAASSSAVHHLTVAGRYGGLLAVDTATHPALGSQVYDMQTVRYPADPPLSPICEAVTSDIGMTQAYARPLRNSSLQSVAGDSGVDDGECTHVSDYHSITAQIQLRFWYNKRDLVLNVGIEQLKNAFCLSSSRNVQVAVKLGLVPPECAVVGDLSSKRLPMDRLLVFSDVFQFHLRRNVITTKTLQLTVWAYRSAEDLSGECLGTSLVSLAEYSETSWFTKWVNIVQLCPRLTAGPPAGEEKTPLSIKRHSASTSPFIANLLASSDLIEYDVDDNDNGDGGKSESDCLSVIIRDESSDDSIASTSQASTLTRGQHYVGDFDEFDEDEESHSGDTSEEDDSAGGVTRGSPSSALSVLEYPSSSLAAESGYGHSGDTLAELCDKETNTEGALAGSLSSLALTSRGDNNRRKHSGNQSLDKSFARYSCRLNRSDSDSCVPHHRQVSEGSVNFARAAMERRSLRWNRQRNTEIRPILTKHEPINMKTALDLELDLKASQVKLQNLNDEVSRLRSLAQKLVEVKNSTDPELPEWFTDLENDLGRVSIKEEENGPTTPRATKVNRMLRKTLKEIQKFQRSKSGQKPELAAFRKTIASFMDVSHSIRVSDALYHSDEDETLPSKPETPTGSARLQNPQPSTSGTPSRSATGTPEQLPVVGNRIVVFAPKKFFDKDRRGVEV